MITPLRQCANGGMRIASDGLAVGCCDACEQLKSRIVAMCEQRGFYFVRKTGYLYHLTDTEKPIVPSMLHWVTWTVAENAYTYRLHSLDCDCGVQIVAELRGTTPTSLADFGYGFFASADACTGLCADNIAILVAQAINNGWTIKGGGILVQKTSAEYSCYRFDYDPIAVSLVVDTGTTYKFVGCDCSFGDVSVSNYALYTYLEYAACECIDKRELILAYPEVFGVEDISFGDDTVAEQYSSSVAQAYYQSFLQQHEYCDYRNMFVVFDNECTGRTETTARKELVVFHPPHDYQRSWEFVFGAYTINFVGHIAPFTESADSPWSGVDWLGSSIEFGNGSGGEYDIGDYYSKSDAEAAVAASSVSTVVLEIDCREHSSMSPVPFHVPQVVAGYVEYNDWNGMWTAYRPHYEEGRWYAVRFIYTNKGYLVMGEDGPQECFVVKGYDALSQYIFDVIEVKYCGVTAQDSTRCTDVLDNMGGCQSKDWWDAIIEEYRDESVSESESEVVP